MSKIGSEEKLPEQSGSSIPSGGSDESGNSNPIVRALKWIFGVIDGHVFPGPIGRFAVAIVIFLAGLAWTETYQYVQRLFEDPEDSVKNLAQKQKVAFDKIDVDLKNLQGSVDGNGRKILASIENSVVELKKSNEVLVSRLREAKEENVGGKAEAPSPQGVYLGDFVVVREQGSIVVDASTSVGIQSISKRFVTVRVSSLLGESSSRKNLSVGESVDFRREDGRSCKTTLISLSEEQGAAMRTACGSQ